MYEYIYFSTHHSNREVAQQNTATSKTEANKGKI